MTSSFYAFFHKAFILLSAIKEQMRGKTYLNSRFPAGAYLTLIIFITMYFFQFIMNYSYKIPDET